MNQRTNERAQLLQQFSLNLNFFFQLVNDKRTKTTLFRNQWNPCDWRQKKNKRYSRARRRQSFDIYITIYSFSRTGTPRWKLPRGRIIFCRPPFFIFLKNFCNRSNFSKCFYFFAVVWLENNSKFYRKQYFLKIITFLANAAFFWALRSPELRDLSPILLFVFYGKYLNSKTFLWV